MDKILSSPRYTLLAVNFLFVITGIIVLSVGISVQSAYSVYHEFLTSVFSSLPAFCIAAGIIIFLIAAAGFYCAFAENTMMNMVFAGFMVIIFIFQLSACIAGYVLQGNSMSIVQKELDKTILMYEKDKDTNVTRLWDDVQRDFECCGSQNATDWMAEPVGGLPVSCCPPVYGTVTTFTCTVANAYSTACADEFGKYVKSFAASIGTAGIFLILMQIIVVAGAAWVVKIAI